MQGRDHQGRQASVFITLNPGHALLSVTPPRLQDLVKFITEGSHQNFCRGLKLQSGNLRIKISFSRVQRGHHWFEACPVSH